MLSGISDKEVFGVCNINFPQEELVLGMGRPLEGYNTCIGYSDLVETVWHVHLVH